MATIPKNVAETELSRRMLPYLHRQHQGKVRDTYGLVHPNVMLPVATDRISIFDFVLGTTIPMKGEVLVGLTVFWLQKIFPHSKHHLLAYGRAIDGYLPKELRGNLELHKRAIVVEKKTMLLVECIVRGYLTGSGLKAYQEDQAVCGIPLPEGLTDGSELPEPIFTPTTKAKVGHDEHVTAESVEKEHGSWPRVHSIAFYKRAQLYAESKGIIIADTKFEFGEDRTLADEVLTPDSSRFWDKDEYDIARKAGKSPSGYDKERVRQAGKKAVINGQVVDISKLDPENPEHVELVASWQVPQEIIEQTTRRYRTIVQRLTGMELEQFQSEVMDVT
jgi:phosphoribosylaminoimidazole-succinocarboxamide synthase